MPNRNTETTSENEALLQGVIDSLAGHVAILDRDGTILKTNRSWQDLAAHNLNDGQNFSPGANYIEACRELSSDPIGERLAAGVKEVADGQKEVFEIEFTFQAAAETRWYSTRVSSFGRGEDRRLIIFHENITTRKETEKVTAHLADIVKFSGDAIVSKDLNGVVTSWNKGAEKFSAGRPKKSPANRSLF